LEAEPVDQILQIKILLVIKKIQLSLKVLSIRKKRERIIKRKKSSIKAKIK
jgi:hypothetical protein